MTNDEKVFFEETRFSGHLNDGGDSVEISCLVRADADARLHLSMSDPDQQIYRFVSSQIGDVGSTILEFQINVSSPCGWKLLSDSVSVSRCVHANRNYEIELDIAEVTLRKRLKNAVERPYRKLWLRGLRSFRGHRSRCVVGDAILQAGAFDINADDASGFVAVRAIQAEVEEQWEAQSLDCVKHLQLGMSFARGGRLQGALMEYANGVELECIFYRGRG